MDTQWPKDFLPEIERRGASARGACRFAPETGLRRSETEAFIAAVFARAHGARIRKFMPLLLGLRNRGGRLTAACGLRAAGGAIYNVCTAIVTRCVFLTNGVFAGNGGQGGQGGNGDTLGGNGGDGGWGGTDVHLRGGVGHPIR